MTKREEVAKECPDYRRGFKAGMLRAAEIVKAHLDIEAEKDDYTGGWDNVCITILDDIHIEIGGKK